MDNIIDKIKKAKLIGRGGACFPVDVKWNMVKNANGDKKYVVCNASEGEPGVKKDGYILENYPEIVIDGMKIAMDFLNASKAYIYLNPSYFKKLEKKLKKIIGDLPIEVFKKPHNAGYIGGEETSVINGIEGRRIEPRLRPPFPTTNGLWRYPTLINNVETFYNVSLVNSGEYKNKRFYTISGDCMHEGVYDLPDDWTIEKILKETKNYPRCDKNGKPKFSFFAQIGGDASGEVLNDKQLKRQATGAGSITIYSVIKHKPINVIKKWLDFFMNESCGQCTPCREGVYRLREIIKSPNPDWKLFADLLDNLDDTAFCGLGCSVSISIKTYMKNVLNNL
ncbi:MAG: NADH-ubiquinone oxidoreductase-F iron-sulfur binding region domain-containing protein [Candidatus Falkowbacteria bacterium]